MTELLSLEEVSACYGESVVLSCVSISANEGSLTCILGANGAGKTTLARTILGLTPTVSGRVMFRGEDITKLPPHERVAKGIACVPEGRKVFPKMSVEENLQAGAYLTRDSRLIKERLSAVYEVFPRLRERRSQWAGTMSGGEQAMVSIGRALMGAPQLLVVDEPSLGLSPALVKESFRIVQQINDSGVAVLLIEQNVNQTLAVADFGYVLAQGRVAASGVPEALRNDKEINRAYFGADARAN